MRKKDFTALIQPLLPRLHSLAICLLPDDLQAQQLVTDALTTCLLKEKRAWLEREYDPEDRRAQIHLRKLLMKSLVTIMVDLGARRAAQLRASLPDNPVVRDFPQFYRLDPKARAVAWMRLRQGWGMEEIERMAGLKRHEVVEKVHNARFLLMGQPPHWAPASPGAQL